MLREDERAPSPQARGGRAERGVSSSFARYNAATPRASGFLVAYLSKLAVLRALPQPMAGFCRAGRSVLPT